MRNRNFKSYASWAEQVLARMFYRHGVFCASHPMLMLSFSILIALVIGSPTVYKATKRLFWSTQVNEPDHFWDTPASREPVDEERFVQRFGKDPVLRIEQVVINASAVADNYVGVLEKPVLMYVLDLERRIERARASVDCAGVLFDHGTSLTAANLIEFGLGDICYKALGDNRCLVHTPLEFWSSNPDILSRDPDLLATLSTAPRLSSFGIPLPFSSVFTDIVTRNERKSDKFRNASLSSRELVSAGSIVITFFLKDLDAVQFGGCKTSDLWDKLWNDSILDHRSERGYGYAGAGAITRVDDPLERVWRGKGDVKHLYYQFGENVQRITSEHVVLAISYSLVFLYISLVLGRVDLVKSKFGLGAAAVCMVLYSFAMSIGLCEFLGVETSVLVPWEVLPFLIILMGVENIYVLTNAVVTTSLDLPVRERVGMGLGKVGLRMITSLTTEMSILLIGSAINIPALQEFCLFGAVSLVISFFMEVTFFVTVLAIDIRRLEVGGIFVRLLYANCALVVRSAQTPSTQI
ncbi:sterol-sensing domain of SREBP cleavage-activation-domain-containing protein [Cladochytrium replicatum]|nr:sterol-sensing domain of SREBP cleavage-activation-domain-containing protein [Cladochytrium replicatum]